MHVKIAFALLIGVVIIGMQSAAADCTDKYIGDNHALYKAYVSHPCPNQYTYAEYSIYGDSTADFDLYVMDTYDQKLYKSTARSSSEQLKVPIHCSYPHYVYVFVYSGSGNWRVCSPQVGWGEGFKEQIGVHSPPVPSTYQTVPSGPEDSIVGKWRLLYDWGCTGSALQGELNFKGDGTLIDEGDKTATWTRTGDKIHIAWDTGPAVYDGTVKVSTMGGTMKGSEINPTGCWSASKIEA